SLACATPFSANSRKTGGTSNFGISNLGISNFGISKAGAVTATGFGLDFGAEEVVVSAIRKHPLIARAFLIGPSALGKIGPTNGDRHAPSDPCASQLLKTYTPIFDALQQKILRCTKAFRHADAASLVAPEGQTVQRLDPCPVILATHSPSCLPCSVRAAISEFT